MHLAKLRTLYLTAILATLGASPALADLSWNFTSGNESFSLITTGNVSDLAGHPPGSVTFLAIDFQVHNSALFSGMNGASVSNGQLELSGNWGLEVIWNGDPTTTGYGCDAVSGCWINIFKPGTQTGYQLYERFGGIGNRAFLVQNNSPIAIFNTSVTPVSAVPEPGTMAFLASGLAGMLAFRRFRREPRRRDTIDQCTGSSLPPAC